LLFQCSNCIDSDLIAGVSRTQNYGFFSTMLQMGC
jgi:hypothetical protein